jgi:hypothetical protein
MALQSARKNKACIHARKNGMDGGWEWYRARKSVDDLLKPQVLGSLLTTPKKE